MISSLLNFVNTAVLLLNIGDNFNDTIEISDEYTSYYYKNTSEDQLVSIKPNKDVRYFHKCCPLGSVYEPEYRRCVETNYTSSIEDNLSLDIKVNLYKFGLDDCEVIVDRLIHNISAHKFNSNHLIIGESEVFSYGKFCVDRMLDSMDYVARVCYEKDYCTDGIYGGNKLWCLKKCCKDGLAVRDGGCNYAFDFGLNVTEHSDVFEKTDDFAVYYDRDNCKTAYIGDKEKYDYQIKSNGSIYVFRDDYWIEYTVSEHMYCFETFYNPTTSVKRGVILLCVESDIDSTKYILSRPCMIISCICLVMTILVYVFVQKMKKIIEKVIIFYCIYKIIGFIILIWLQFQPNPGEACVPAGFVFHYAFIGSFSWLNVMGYDMWRTLGTMRTRVGQTKKSELKKLLYYCTYAVVVPAIFTLLLYVANAKIHPLPESIYPYIGDTLCLLEPRLSDGNYGHTLYFVLPIGILISFNIVFFVKTTIYFVKAKRDLDRVKKTSIKEKTKRFQLDKKNMAMVVKLSLVMGITWIFEIISSVINFNVNSVAKFIEISMDTFNCLQGAFIFLIFIVKWGRIKRIVKIMRESILTVVSNLSRQASEHTTTSSSNASTKPSPASIEGVEVGVQVSEIELGV